MEPCRMRILAGCEARNMFVQMRQVEKIVRLSYIVVTQLFLDVGGYLN